MCGLVFNAPMYNVQKQGNQESKANVNVIKNEETSWRKHLEPPGIYNH